MHHCWLVVPETLNAIMAARRDCTDLAPVVAWEMAEAATDAPAPAADTRYPRNMKVAGSSAEIRVEGVLTKRPDFWSVFFGGGNTTYQNIIQSLALAAQEPAIREVVLHVDSPGGQVDGLFEALDAIAAFRAGSGKKLRVRAEQAQSAAYAIAAAAGTIEATARGASFGSIGTAVAYYVSDSVVTITNTDSPDKRPDVRTDEGKAVVRKYLDQLNDEFVRAIAQGRGVDVRAVREDYGRGASMTAVEAKRLGMIDKIATTQAPRAVQSKQGKKSMEDDQDSRAAIASAEARGVTRERQRVAAHLTMGESCGDMSIALECIRSGAEMTVDVQARYMAAGMNRADRQRRQVESNTAEAVLEGTGGATSSASAPDLGDQVVAELTKKASFVRG